MPGRATTVAVHRHGIDGAQNPAEDGIAKEGLAGEIVDVALQSGANQRRIEKAGVIGGEDDRPIQRDAAGIVNVPAKIKCKDGTVKTPADEIDGIHVTRSERTATSPLPSPPEAEREKSASVVSPPLCESERRIGFIFARRAVCLPLR